MSESTKKKTAPAGSKQKTPQKKPVRREVWALVLLALSLFVTVSYFDGEAVIVNWIAKLLKGVLGYGYWMMAPALLITGIILLFHHGRPIYLRISCALLLPLIGSSLCHMILVAPMTSEHIIKDLWNMGLIVKSGGVLAGGLAIIFVKLFVG